MKKLYLLTLLFSSALFGEESTTTDGSNTEETRTSYDQFSLSSNDITDNGFVIREDGIWYLTDDVEYDGINPPITIAKSNVVLDLNGNTLSLKSKGNSLVSGVVVAEGANNVTITNGTIQGFSQAGVFVNPPHHLPIVKAVHSAPTKKKSLFDMAEVAPKEDLASFSTKQSAIITISDIKAIDNGSSLYPYGGINGMGGIIVFNAMEVDVYDCEVRDNYFSGITGIDVTSFNLEDSLVHDTKSSYLAGNKTPFAIGALIASYRENCYGIRINNINFSTKSADGVVLGLHINKIHNSSPSIYDVQISKVNDPSMIIRAKEVTFPEN